MKFEFDLDKLINAIIFFANHTVASKLGKTKLLKLLFFSDFTHMKKYGRPIIGDTYFKLPLGPVPSLTKDLLGALENEEADLDWGPGVMCKLSDAIEIKTHSCGSHTQHRIVAKKAFDPNHFSESDIEVMSEVARKYHDFTGRQIASKSHEHPAYQSVLIENSPIDYSHAFDPEDKAAREYYEHWSRELTELDLALR